MKEGLSVMASANNEWIQSCLLLMLIGVELFVAHSKFKVIQFRPSTIAGVLVAR